MSGRHWATVFVVQAAAYFGPSWFPHVATAFGDDLTEGQRANVLKKALSAEWNGVKHKDKGGDMDCSLFVWSVYKQAGRPYGNQQMSTEQITKSDKFVTTTTAKPGDLILWPSRRVKVRIGDQEQEITQSGHVGIVTDVTNQKFVGCQSSTGVAPASYDPPSFWGKRPFVFCRLK